MTTQINQTSLANRKRTCSRPRLCTHRLRKCAKVKRRPLLSTSIRSWTKLCRDCSSGSYLTMKRYRWRQTVWRWSLTGWLTCFRMLLSRKCLLFSGTKILKMSMSDYRWRSLSLRFQLKLGLGNLSCNRSKDTQCLHLRASRCKTTSQKKTQLIGQLNTFK